MKAIVYDDFGTPPTLRTVPDPSPPPSGVVLAVEATGVCRSDWHGWQGHDPMIDPPHVPGHEVVGTIAEVGADVSRWSNGERVTVPFVGGCGTCPHCRSGEPQVCPNQFQPGFSAWGAFAEYVMIDYADANLVRLPDGLAPVTAASLGCRFATAFRAVVDQGDVRAGDWVAVHGCGGIGLSAVMIANAVGAQVVAVDVSDEALSLASSVGATHTINAEAVPNVVAAVRDHTHGGAHVSLDGLGSAETAYNSVSCLRTHGRHVQVGLLVGDDAATALPMDRVVADELEIRGTHGIQAHRYPAMFDMIDAGSLAPETLIRRTIPLSDAGTALTQIDDSPAGVTVVSLSQTSSSESA
jgi:alcohol dehydrogenase